ncbi:MAG: STAS domain-containing protein [Selenomonadaceae bacterium]|nr:STAS domain-containing protein [Selenomonadaceae bacterium]
MKIFVSGMLDVLTAAAFRKEVAKISSDVSKVIFDFREVNYISSAGLRELLICRKKFSDMRIENVSREVLSRTR